ncbi:hypothetical protein ACH50_08140 [Franconibacter pulveris]|uniref:Uncharacterized protein n=1 Tax=Franconibacter pulveris TaxID=435910 RepID=A0A0J8VQJ0_9ENTR|nr:hypothetical protein ACH50_08140 [Franconibacter pulveris]
MIDNFYLFRNIKRLRNLIIGDDKNSPYPRHKCNDAINGKNYFIIIVIASRVKIILRAISMQMSLIIIELFFPDWIFIIYPREYHIYWQIDLNFTLYIQIVFNKNGFLSNRASYFI